MDVPRAAAVWKGFTPAYIDAWIGYPLQLAFRILSTLTLDHTLLGWELGGTRIGGEEVDISGEGRRTSTPSFYG